MTHSRYLPSSRHFVAIFILQAMVMVGVFGCSFVKKVTSTITAPIQARIQRDPIKVNLASGPEISLTSEDFTHSVLAEVGDGTAGVASSVVAGNNGSVGLSSDENQQSDITSTDGDILRDPILDPAVSADRMSSVSPRPAYIATARPGSAVTVSGLVGQVNGRPIFVDEVLTPIADQLAIWGNEKTYDDYFRDALILIKRQLRTVVENELLLAEAERSLDSNQRIGLINFIDDMRKGTIRKYGGTETQAEQRLQADQGITLQEHLNQLRKQILIREQVRNNIAGNIIVSWHDVERYYRNNPKEFNPPASIQLRIIAVKDTDPVKKDTVIAAFDAGQPFEIIAQEHSDLLATASGLMSPVKLPQGLAEAKVTIWPSVNDAIRNMHEGDMSGPFTVPSYFVWVLVEVYEDGKPISLYDAQKDIEGNLRDRYFQEETAKYFQKLLDRGNYDDFEQMAQSLLAVALDRWAPAAN